MPKSTYLDNAMINAVLRATTFTSPATVYTALFNGVPGSGGTEATGGSYARQATAFGAPSGGASSNSAQLTFTNMPVVTVNYVAVYDAVTAGNLLYYAAATTAKTTNAGDTVTISAGSLSVTES